MSAPARLLLADDHPETQKLLFALLDPEFDVVGVVSDGEALVSAAEWLLPDVVVTDITMPGLDGVAAAARIRKRNPAIRVVLVTVHGDAGLVAGGLAAGAHGYVLKSAAGDELVPAVHAVVGGQQYVSRAIGASGNYPSHTR